MDRSEPIPEEVKAGDIEKAGERFAADMRARREAQGIPLSRIQQETRLSEGVLEEFEATGLATSQIFNRVYLRSLVISYSKIVGLDPEDSLSALEAALDGTYEGGLGVGQEVDAHEDVESELDDQGEAVTSDHGSDEISVPAELGGLNAETSGLSDHGQQQSGESDEDTPSRPYGTRFEFISSIEHERSGSELTVPPESTRPRVKTEISTAIHDFRPPESQKGVIVATDRFRSIALGSLVVIVSVSAIFLAIRLSKRVDADTANGGSPSSEVIPQQEVAVLPPDPIPPAAPLVTLGDTINVTLVAEGGPLDPVRVQLDSDLRRPFWVEAGDSMSFRMSRRIVIQDLLALLSVKLEGLPYPIDSYSDPDRVVITRDSVEAFVESLPRR